MDNSKIFVEAVKRLYDATMDKRRFFYHYGYYEGSNHIPINWVTTNKLIEVTRDYYFNTLLPLEDKIGKEVNMPWHRPCAYGGGFEKLEIIQSL